VTNFPRMIAPADHIEPVPRHVRATLGGVTVIDTTAAIYVWEWPNYPQYYIPIADVRAGVLVDEERTQHLKRGIAHVFGLHAGTERRDGAARLFGGDALAGLAGMVRFNWDALDSWFEETEEVFVHPRNPYTRVDALRSDRHVEVMLDGRLLAASSAPVLVFETGLPTRYYFDRTDVHFEHLVATDTVTACPYKGRTTGYWSVRTGDGLVPDLAWSYDFPTRQLLPIAGLVAFYDEKVDVTVDGTPQVRPRTHFH
jgi:uncharacterized protein (DUF427 family)